MKRVLSILILLLVGIFLGGCTKNNETKKVKIGICTYDESDVFVSSIVSEVREKLLKYSDEILVKVESAYRDQHLQDEEIDYFIKNKYDIICINLVERRWAQSIIEKVKKANIPIIFFNREPVYEDLKIYDKAFYVGGDPKNSGVIQGEVIKEAYVKDRGIDKNGDGKLQYIMFEGEEGHMDAMLRTEFSIKKLKAEGVFVEKLGSEICDWKRSIAKEKMKEFYLKFGNDIEVIISNNDDMALGAIDYLKDVAGKEDMPFVIGADGIDEAIDSANNGFLGGTIITDYKKHGDAIFNIVVDILEEKEIDFKYFRIENEVYKRPL